MQQLQASPSADVGPDKALPNHSLLMLMLDSSGTQLAAWNAAADLALPNGLASRR
jgi:hypothetical protein